MTALPGSAIGDAAAAPASPSVSGIERTVAVLTIGLVLWFGFQTSALIRERRHIAAARANQEPLIQQAQRVRVQLDALARSTLQLAQQGNPSAALIVDQLARRGITINPQAPSTPAPAPAT